MKKIICLFGLLVLAACAGGSGSSPPAPVPVVQGYPSDPAWSLKEGSWVEYRILRGKATYQPSTGLVVPDEASLVAGETIRVTNLRARTPSGVAIARVHTSGGVEATTVDPGFVGSLVECQAGRIIGECANAGSPNITPPEPLLLAGSYPGEVLETVSMVTWTNGAAPSSFYTRYQTVSIGDQETTTLVEQPQTDTPTAYVQIFKGGELIEQRAALLPPGQQTYDVSVGRLVSSGVNLPAAPVGP